MDFGQRGGLPMMLRRRREAARTGKAGDDGEGDDSGDFPDFAVAIFG